VSSLTPYKASRIAEMCARLDGLPLAIELAAVRTRQMSMRFMLAKLSSRLAIGDEGPRDLLGRQRTLRATIAWSCDLLWLDEQRLLAILGALANGLTREAVTSVSVTPSDESITVAKVLESLVDQSRSMPFV
jgi:predicted ATPase